ncbi:MAG: sigma-54-dependent Fis family transcriptional regulator [Acidobacteria bacterium]|nr:sigma-54-dependent Fis family transcriptional regulator [Acidobacteriota bacterium]
MRVLIVDDEQSMRELLEYVFREDGFTVATAAGITEAASLLETQPFEVIISDLRMEDGSGLDLLQIVQQRSPESAFILITAYASSDSAIDALKYGAYDYITKPFDVDELKRIVHQAAEKIRQSGKRISPAADTPKPPRIIGKSPVMIKIYKTIGVIAPTNSTILLTGESGTGKELIARIIHESSPRKENEFVSINCGAFPETLLESELFGYQKGAFTGATTPKRGLFEAAHKGTLFLDEIAETSPSMQVKLLRAIQSRRIRRLGGVEEIEVDVRIIAATNQNLLQLIKEDRFREDLYYRLAVIPIHLPPLRERAEDIPELVSHFVKKYTTGLGKSISGLTPAAMAVLNGYSWPGNVRELENTIERAVALETTDKIREENFMELRHGPAEAPGPSAEVAPVTIGEDGLDLEPYLQEMERRIIRQALARCGGVQIEAARLLNVSYRSLRHRMQKLGIH